MGGDGAQRLEEFLLITAVVKRHEHAHAQALRAESAYFHLQAIPVTSAHQLAHTLTQWRCEPDCSFLWFPFQRPSLKPSQSAFKEPRVIAVVAGTQRQGEEQCQCLFSSFPLLWHFSEELMWFWAATWLREWLEPRARSSLFVMRTVSLSYRREQQAASPVHKTVRETNCAHKSADGANLCPFTCNWYWHGTPWPWGAPEPNIGYRVSVWEVCLVETFLNIREDNTFYRNAYGYLLCVLFVFTTVELGSIF